MALSNIATMPFQRVSTVVKAKLPALILLLAWPGLTTQLRAQTQPPATAQDSQLKTRVSIQDARWFINGRPAGLGSPAEGLLMNARMVNAVFEDRNRSDFDAEENTRRFLERIPEYAAHGVRTFTLGLQGGMPGYEGALNSAFNPDGSLRESYLARVERVLAECDRLGLVVILSCFYQRQDQVLRDEQAVRTALVNTVRWLRESGHHNVLLEIANEFPHDGFDHRVLRSVPGQLELIRLAHDTAPGLLVSSSGLGDGRISDEVARAADFILIHFNGTPVEAIPERIRALGTFGKPVVCNEDDKLGAEAVRAMRACVENGASWGFMHKEQNQFVPFTFQGAADDPDVYRAFRALATP